ncbi:BTB/POZ protein [Tribonema minus]|uniref:BTB/POZ protein n=1 Tax=Tribonema minus TaxID=303371 RepID=A0A836CP50_9STRA|nr:BTB/POZ protein [Tribonema minus]
MLGSAWPRQLNVGGRRFCTSIETIQGHGNSMLAAMFSNPLYKKTEDAQGFVFIDRDGDRFPHVLNFLRCGSLPSFDEAWRYEAIMEEADFFAVEELKQLCAARVEESAQAKEKEEERAKSMSCRVTIVEAPKPLAAPLAVAALTGELDPGPQWGTGVPPREAFGTFEFTLDEDF